MFCTAITSRLQDCDFYWKDIRIQKKLSKHSTLYVCCTLIAVTLFVRHRPQNVFLILSSTPICRNVQALRQKSKQRKLLSSIPVIYLNHGRETYFRRRCGEGLHLWAQSECLFCLFLSALFSYKWSGMERSIKISVLQSSSVRLSWMTSLISQVSPNLI